MPDSKQKALIKKDLKMVFANKQMAVGIILVPLILVIVLPSIFVISINVVTISRQDLSEFGRMIELLPASMQNNDMKTLMTDIVLNMVMPIFFLIIPIMAATITAASSFVGEKERSTLETLLYSPLSLREIIRSKIYASTILSIIVYGISFIAMLIITEIEMLIITGNFWIPSISWIIILVITSPAISCIAITMIVRGSAKASTMEEAQQKTVFVILPVLVLIIGQFTGFFIMSTGLLLIVSAVMVVIAFLMLKAVAGKMSYERMLT